MCVFFCLSFCAVETPSVDAIAEKEKIVQYIFMYTTLNRV